MIKFNKSILAVVTMGVLLVGVTGCQKKAGTASADRDTVQSAQQSSSKITAKTDPQK